MNEQSRLKMSYVVMALAFLGGIIKLLWSAFDLAAVFGLVGIAYGGYMAVRTISNIDEAKYANGKKL